ncbi:MAG: bifunctional DNA-formamidopyrimidine glycosylase/DNA-(apurinic or apyrimidinic site) lyase [Geobacter sp.]|nr:bifunctional DNA-formamidopyrimidine glycosylase/DNA-(apurinic or apyrimidinic site) lyase [Geobacter sp.]
MPELPEVETTRRAIMPHIAGKKILQVVVRTLRLRQPIPDLACLLPGRTVQGVERRGKYLLIACDHGWLIIHLGMSGNLWIVPAGSMPGKHDHLDILLERDTLLRFNDPRRFGLVLWTGEDPLHHPLLAAIGPEPLGDSFSGDYLFRVSRRKKTAIKQLIMESGIVAGVGNIYASEALFRAAIHPALPAGELDPERAAQLAAAIREVLQDSIEQGGTTIRDFRAGEETSGYYAVRLAVYGREGEPCPRCGARIDRMRLGGRSTYFCADCQI